jgi:hypothetical protein
MENPPKVEGGHRRAMSDDCDVVIRDVEDGVVLVIDNRDKIMYTMRFDFGASENLKLVPGTGVEAAGPMKCNIEVQPGTVRNLCHLQIADRETLDHFEMKYRVQCLVRNAKGELEQVRPPAPKAEKEERKKLTDTLDIIFLEQGGGYVVFFESSDADQYRCVLDISGSQNLELLTGPGTTTVDATKCSFAVDPRSRVAVAKLDLVDPSKPITLSYRVKHEKDSSRTVAADKAKADDAAAAKKKADDAAAKKKADDDAAAAKKKADDDAAAAKKKAEDDERQRLATAEAKGKWEAEWRVKYELLWKEEITIREKVEIEQRGRYVLLQREYRESICNLCRGLFKAGQDMVAYKIYKLHQVCYDKAPKCDWCGDILIGEYVVTKGDLSSGTKLHKECIEPYKKKARPVCVGCNQQIMDDQWSSAGGKPYHHSCRK